MRANKVHAAGFGVSLCGRPLFGLFSVKIAKRKKGESNKNVCKKITCKICKSVYTKEFVT